MLLRIDKTLVDWQGTAVAIGQLHTSPVDLVTQEMSSDCPGPRSEAPLFARPFARNGGSCGMLLSSPSPSLDARRRPSTGSPSASLCCCGTTCASPAGVAGCRPVCGFTVLGSSHAALGPCSQHNAGRVSCIEQPQTALGARAYGEPTNMAINHTGLTTMSKFLLPSCVRTADPQ